MNTVDHAARMLLQTKVSETVFKEQCKETEAELCDEYDGVIQLFCNALNHGPLKLKNGAYLYMKPGTSVRALNRERLCHAIDLVTVKQMDGIRQDAMACDTHTALCRAIEQNLLKECVQITETPCVANQRPKTINPTEAVRPANDHVENAVISYHKLKELMRVVRKHKKEGMTRCNQVSATMLPVMVDHMLKNKQKVQHVSVQSAADAQVSVQPIPVVLPSLPKLPSVPVPDVVEEPACKKVMVLQADESLPSMQAEFKHRTYTSRGKAPNVRMFIKEVIYKLPPIDATWPDDAELPFLLNQVQETLLAQFHEMFKASSGKVTEKVAIKIK
jgi:hypothetical protein